MESPAQAEAYARADFSAPHQRFVELFNEKFPNLDPRGTVLDLGCGPGDIALRFAQAHPHCTVHGLDGLHVECSSDRHVVIWGNR